MASATTDHVVKSDLFDPFDESLIVAPYAAYERLRAADPVHWNAPLRAWVLSRLDDVKRVLNDRSFVAADAAKNVLELGRRSGRKFDSLIRVLETTLFYMEGAGHQKTRRVIAKALNRIPSRQLGLTAEEIAAALAAKLSKLEKYDVIADFAEPLPHGVMAKVFGLRESDVVTLNKLLARLTLGMDAAAMEVFDDNDAKARVALGLMQTRIAEAASANAENGLADIYNGTSGPQAERLERAAAMALFAIRVGTETTTALIGFLVRALIDRPWLRQKLRDDPSCAQTVVSEVLRLEGMVQRSMRICTQATVIGGKTIQAGDRVMLLLGAANRDPAAFAAPDDLSLAPRRTTDVSFGDGRHYCPGGTIAQLEGRIALEHLVRLPPVERAGDEVWYVGRSIRRLTHLPVRVTRSVGAGSP